MRRVLGALARAVPTLLLSLLLSPSGAMAEQGGTVFAPPHDVVLMWAKRAGLVVMICSVLLILFELIIRQHRLMEGSSKWRLFLALCALPVPVMFLAAGVGMEASKDVEFCESCHRPMGPFVRDMKNPKSDHLAAVHYKNRLIQKEQCWTCHSNYGIAGTTSAKLTGLLHITKVVRDNWQAPIKLYKPYNWSICLGCHAAAERFRKPRKDDSAHDGIVAAVHKGETSCTDCHPAAHPDRKLRSSK